MGICSLLFSIVFDQSEIKILYTHAHTQLSGERTLELVVITHCILTVCFRPPSPTLEDGPLGSTAQQSLYTPTTTCFVPVTC